MPVAPGFRRLLRIEPHIDIVAVRQADHEHRRLASHPANYDLRFAEVDLGVAGLMGQRDIRLFQPKGRLPDIILDCRIAAVKTVFVAEAIENPFCRMALLLRRLQIRLQDIIDDTDKRPQLCWCK